MRNRPEFPTVVIVLVLLVLTVILQPNFFSEQVILSNIATFTPLILASIGQAIIIIGGGLDLSLGAAISLFNCILASFMGDSTGTAIMAFAFAIGAAILIGLVNGLVAGYLKLPPMIATFATSSIWFGIALFLMPQPGGSIPFWGLQFYSFNIGIVSTPLLLILLSLAGWSIVRRRKIGNYIYAVGSNEFGAYANGVNAQKTKCLAYVIGSLFVMLASISITFQISSGDAYMGLPYTLTTIAATVIGGISLSGGKGNVIGAVFGAIILNLVINLIYFANIPSTYQEFSKGLIIILALGASIMYRRKEKVMAHL